MGKHASDYELEKKKELVKVFLELLGNGDTIAGAMRKAVTCPCSRYWISIESAMRNISLARKGLWSLVRRAEMIRSIMEKCNGDFSRDSVESVIYNNAPHFFMTPNSGRVIIYNEIKKRRCQQKQSKQQL